MNPEDRHFYRPALGWGSAIGAAAFVTEYVANDATLGRALLWTIITALAGGLFFARLLTLGDRPRRPPLHYAPPDAASEGSGASKRDLP